MRETAPPLNRRELAEAIECALKEELKQFAVNKDFELGGLEDADISAFLTENIDVLALSFELVHQASVVLDLDEEIAAKPITNGECSYNLREKSVSDIRKNSVELLDAGRNLIEGKGARHVYLSADSHIDRRRRFYTLREPLDEV